MGRLCVLPAQRAQERNVYMRALMDSYWQELCSRYPQWQGASAAFEGAVRILADCAAAGGRILLCGNGGSAADAEHIAGELMKSFLLQRPVPRDFCERARALFPQQAGELARLQGGIAAIPLVSGAALPTAFANDVDGQLGFAQQVYALARPGDVVWGISTSGNSHNVNQALRVARLLSCRTLGLTGRDGGEMASLLDVELRAPASSTPQIQELHLPMYHALCACLEAIIFGDQTSLQEYANPRELPRPVELLVFDFDGVFTDNRVLTDQNGVESVFCHRGDGLGIDMLRKMGQRMLILSTECNPVVAARAAKLRIPVAQGCRDKAAFLRDYLREEGITPAHTLFMGNDINDLSAMSVAGFAVAPADAHPAVLAVAHWVTKARGGQGAVRELCERLVREQSPDC